MNTAAIRMLTADDTEAFLRLKQVGLSSDPLSFVASLDEDPPDYAAQVRIRLEAIQLIVATHNREAVTLYERFGFTIAWTERHALKVAHEYVDAHHMVLALSEQRASSQDRPRGRMRSFPGRPNALDLRH